ncbi:ribonuclease H-like domain-containing protein [Rhizophagus clarus]|uniref:Ribonuclease H-like domain-containing protein n=1 Tax=Rhizophagus clarus TaxID=94130 RepID=A0A8H3QXY8_9GLOM|nr:ribonuclease H-like domain-containing protein [Rhizophagus clarus]
MEKVRNWENISNKKRKVDKSVVGQTTMTAFHDLTNLSKARINQINSVLVKCFICCGITFRIIEHPFFINLLKELNADYNPSTREYLSNRLLETELYNVNEKINEDIKNQRSLTLSKSFHLLYYITYFFILKALDGWTSGRHQSIWNFIILTPSRKEYLYQLSDLLLDSYTTEYLAMQIEKIIKSVGSDHILAIVSNNAANIRKAKAIINEKYLKIKSVQCISYCINLIACDIVKHNFADRLLHRVNILTAFFCSSHMADLKILAFVLNPLRKAIFSLEFRSATLADCNLNLAKLGAVLKNLPRSFHYDFHVPLKSGVYAKLAKTALSIGKNLGFDLEQSRALCSQLGQYKKKEFPFDLEFGYRFQELINWWNLIETKSEPESLPIVALYLFSICPNSASCKRDFFNLGWLTNKRCLQLGVETLESMCKMIIYWKCNARKEFDFFSQEMKNKSKLNEIELNKRVIEALAKTDNTDEEENNEFEDNSSQPVRRTINDIGNIPKDLDDDFIDNEKNNNKDIVLTDDKIVDDTNGRGILNYNVDDLFNEYVNEN